MLAHRSPENHDPITWFGRVPVYATTIIVALYIACMVAVALLLASGANSALAALTFNSAAVLQDFEVWRCLTYAFVNPPDPWFIIALVMFYIFGRDVEQFLGRRGFLRLYVALLLLGPSLLLAGSLATGQPYKLDQSWANFAIFLSFATLYPNAQLIFNIPAKVFAWVILGVSVLQLLSMQKWTEMLVLLATSALAWYAIRHGSALNLDFLARLQPFARRPRRPQLRIVKEPEEEIQDPHAIIDPLLDKISRQGLASLTRRERERLEQARALLIGRERH